MMIMMMHVRLVVSVAITVSPQTYLRLSGTSYAVERVRNESAAPSSVLPAVQARGTGRGGSAGDKCTQSAGISSSSQARVNAALSELADVTDQRIEIANRLQGSPRAEAMAFAAMVEASLITASVRASSIHAARILCRRIRCTL